MKIFAQQCFILNRPSKKGSFSITLLLCNTHISSQGNWN